MAVKAFDPQKQSRCVPLTQPGSLRARFGAQEEIVVAAGATTAYLGDERNLREFLVAAEAVQMLEGDGHNVRLFLFNDDLDPLNLRQLRVAVEKDPELIQAHASHCGRPISDIESPFPGSPNWARHFESRLLFRLAKYGVFPTVVRASALYRTSFHRACVSQILAERPRLENFLKNEFPAYQPRGFFYPVCPKCGKIADTELIHFGRGEAAILCANCGVQTMGADSLRGKLNWRLDCAVRWQLHHVDVEPFTKAYMEPNAGSFWIARALQEEIFGDAKVVPISVGTVTVESSQAASGIGSLPAVCVRKMMTERWNADLDITLERLRLAAASSNAGAPSFADEVKRKAPALRVRTAELTLDDYDFLCQAERFESNVLQEPLPRARIVTRAIHGLDAETLCGLHHLLIAAFDARKDECDYAAYDVRVKEAGVALGGQLSAVNAAARKVLDHERGLPVRRLLFAIPFATLEILEYAVATTLRAKPNEQHAVVEWGPGRTMMP